MSNRRLKITVSCVALMLLPLCLFIGLYMRRPVVVTDEWIATVTTSNGRIETLKVYKMWGFPNRRFVELPKKLQKRYQWFGIDENIVCNSFSLGNFPYRNFNYDRALGMGLNNPKLEDDWLVEWHGEDVDFSNADLKIRVTKKSK